LTIKADRKFYHRLSPDCTLKLLTGSPADIGHCWDQKRLTREVADYEP